MREADNWSMNWSILDTGEEAGKTGMQHDNITRR